MAINSRHKQRPGEWRDVLAPEVIGQYVGKHIAVIHKKVVAVGDTYEQVRIDAEKAFPSEMPYLAYIPGPDDFDGEDEDGESPTSAAA